MAQLEELVVKLTAQNDELVAAMKSSVAVTEKSAKAMESALDSLEKTAAKDTAGIATAWAVMAGELASQAVMAALTAFKDLFVSVVSDGIAASIEFQDAAVGLNNALVLSGKGAAASSGSLVKFADELEDVTNFSDTALLSSVKLLTTLTKLDEDGLKAATQGAADLAAALGKDLETTTQAVAKAINGNDTALQKMGISLEGVGNGADRTANILAKLSAYGGSAEAATKTFGGQLTQLSNAFGDFTKAIGNIVTSNKTIQNVIGAVSVVFKELEEIIDDNSKGIGEWVSFLTAATVAVAKAFVQMGEFIYRILNTVTAHVSALVGDMMNLFDALGQAVTGDFSGALATMEGSAVAHFETVKEAATGTLPAFEFVKNALDDIGTAAVNGMGQAQVASDQLAATVAASAAAAAEKARQSEAERQALAELGAAQVAQSEQQRALLALDAESNQLALDGQLISQQEYWAARNQLLMDGLANEMLAAQAARDSNALTEQQYQAKIIELQRKAANDKTKLDQDQKKAEDANTKLRLSQAGQFFGDLTTLSQTGSKELGAIAKAAAIAQATIAGIQAVQNALATPPYPVGVALAASAGIAAAVNVAKIASTPLATGIDEVPGVGSRDNFPAMLAPGERVVPAETNQDLKEFLNNGKQGGNTYNINLHDVYTTDPRTLGRIVVDAINDVAQSTGVSFVGVKFA